MWKFSELVWRPIYTLILLQHAFLSLCNSKKSYLLRKILFLFFVIVYVGTQVQVTVEAKRCPILPGDGGARL